MNKRRVMCMHKTDQATNVATGIVLGTLLAVVTVFAQTTEDAEISALEASAPAAAEPQAESPASGAATRLAIPVRETSQHRASNLFAAHSWYKPPPPPPKRPPPPPPEPTAPPLPFSYLGSFQQDGATVYFLVQGDRAYDVKIGDVLDNTYSVDGVSNDQLMFTYLPLKTSQGLPLKEAR
jgi:hypothetical protein